MFWFIIIAIVVATAVWAFYQVPAVNTFFKDLETVAIQAIKAVLGAIASVLAFVDPSLVQNATQTVVTNLGLAQWWPLYALGLGLVMIAVNRFRQKA